jgi:hypothetical protein
LQIENLPAKIEEILRQAVRQHPEAKKCHLPCKEDKPIMLGQ